MSDIVSTNIEGWRPRFHSQALAARSPEVARFIVSLARHGSFAAAAIAAGIPDSTAREWMRDPEAVRGLHAYREWLFRTEGATTGFLTLMAAAEGKDSCPWNVRVQAAKTLLALGGHSEALAAQATQAGQAAKPLHDMTPDELERLISGASATLSSLRRPVLEAAPEPDPPSVTPDSADPASLF